jgi:thymidylate synthase
MLLQMVAYLTDLEPRELIVSIGNAHLYQNHLEQAKEQLQRKPLALPQLKLSGKVASIDDFTEANFSLENYQSHPHIKAPLVIL